MPESVAGVVVVSIAVVIALAVVVVVVGGGAFVVVVGGGVQRRPCACACTMRSCRHKRIHHSNAFAACAAHVSVMPLPTAFMYARTRARACVKLVRL